MFAVLKAAILVVMGFSSTLTVGQRDKDYCTVGRRITIQNDVEYSFKG